MSTAGAFKALVVSCAALLARVLRVAISLYVCIFILVGKVGFDLVKASSESFYFGNKKGSPRSGPPLEEFTKLQSNLVL